MRSGSETASVRFAEDRGPAGQITVVVHDAATPGLDLARIAAHASPRLADALRALGPNSAPVDTMFPEGLETDRLIVWPVADVADCAGGVAALGGRIAATLKGSEPCEAKLIVSTARTRKADAWTTQLLYGALLRAYAFQGYARGGRLGARFPGAFIGAVHDRGAAESCFAPLAARASGIHLARDLQGEPPNILTPEGFAERIRTMAVLGLETEILERDALEAIGMGALLAVARGSAEPPYVAVMRWRGAPDPTARPVVLIGKGVTFDSGGLNIKPVNFQFKMKGDMGGAAAVVGAMWSLAHRKAPVNAVGVVGLVENMPSDRAYRPGDILTTLSGLTVEVTDPDCEGRLLLCDLITYAERTMSPRAIVDVATLTGGARLALGAAYAPLFSNDEPLAARLIALGEEENERLWRMPSEPAYDPMFASKLADMTNGRHDPQAHAIMGGRFLHRFVESTPWAHIDIAAVATTEADADTAPAGFTGFGVALLDRLAGDLAG